MFFYQDVCPQWFKFFFFRFSSNLLKNNKFIQLEYDCFLPTHLECGEKIQNINVFLQIKTFIQEKFSDFLQCVKCVCECEEKIQNINVFLLIQTFIMEKFSDFYYMWSVYVNVEKKFKT